MNAKKKHVRASRRGRRHLSVIPRLAEKMS